MKLSSLVTLAFASALFSASMAVGCSEPDVGGFQGSNAQPGADDDDDDDDSTSSKSTKAHKDTSGTTHTKTDSTTSADTAPAKPAPTPAKPTPQECFTHCVSPVPEAVALDACTLKCADNDTDCLGDCYTTSNCGANPLCDQAIAQCGDKCPQTTN